MDKRERVSKLSERLQNIQNTIEVDRSYKTSRLEEKVRLIEEKFTHSFENSSKKFNLIKTQLEKLANTLEEEKFGREESSDSKEGDIRKTEEAVKYLIDEEIKIRKESELRIYRSIDDKCRAVNEEIEREIDIGISTVDALKGHLENDIPHIQNSLKNEVYEREEQDNIIIKKTSHEFVNLHEQIALEKKAREEGEETIFQMLKEIINKIKEEISIEKREREKTEETLVNLLESTCIKLNAASNI